MNRIIVLIDGMWNKEGSSADTNVAKLDSGKRLAPCIKAVTRDGTQQLVHYHDGVGVDGDWTQKLLGGAIGLGLEKIIQEVYEFIVGHYEEDDETPAKCRYFRGGLGPLSRRAQGKGTAGIRHFGR